MSKLSFAILTLGLTLASCAAPTTGTEQLERGNYAAAVVLFDSALALESEESEESAELHGGRARALHALGELPMAAIAYDRAIRSDPGVASWHVGRAAIHLGLGDPAAAIEACNLALQIDPTLAMAWYDRGLAFERLAQNEAALSDYSRAIVPWGALHMLELEPAILERDFTRASETERRIIAF